jgi:hypothetical protein
MPLHTLRGCPGSSAKATNLFGFHASPTLSCGETTATQIGVQRAIRLTFLTKMTILLRRDPRTRLALILIAPDQSVLMTSLLLKGV